MKIIIWGTGKFAKGIFEYLSNRTEIVAVTDIDQTKWGKIWNNMEIKSPKQILNSELVYDKIVVAIASWRQAKKNIVSQYGIEPDVIDNIYFLQRIQFLKRYDSMTRLSVEQRCCVEYIRENGLDVFNYEFAEKYDNIDIPVYYDSEKDMYFVYYHDNRMYLSRDYRNKSYIENYMRSILREQDVNSPHNYRVNKLNCTKDTVVLDAGVAEGNFALEIVDRVKKMYLVEADSNWCEALRYTFEPYGEKVVIIQGYLGSGTDGSITIDEIVGNQKLDVVKMDIEGMEYEALLGARKVMESNPLQMRICVYHNVNDCEKISDLLKQRMYTCNISNGYMVFAVPEKLEKEESPQLVRGILCAEKSV